MNSSANSELVVAVGGALVSLSEAVMLGIEAINERTVVARTYEGVVPFASASGYYSAYWSMLDNRRLRRADGHE